MANDTPPPGKPAAKAPDAADPKPAAKPAASKAPAARPPALDERPLRLADLAPFAAQLDAGELIAMLRDGRGVVRANAALALGVLGQPVGELLPLLRDSEARVAAAVAEALGASWGPSWRRSSRRSRRRSTARCPMSSRR
jgi:hypothetical protein